MADTTQAYLPLAASTSSLENDMNCGGAWFCDLKVHPLPIVMNISFQSSVSGVDSVEIGSMQSEASFPYMSMAVDSLGKNAA